MSVRIPSADEPGMALEARGLSKRYGRGSWALRDLDLAIPFGGVTALVGPNAAGKSTLIRSWLGFERPTEGEVRVAAVDPNRHRSDALACVGYVPQMAQMYEALSVQEHLDLVGRLRPQFGASIAQDRLEELGIPLQARGRELSGGQQSQVILAMALATQAPILLLDEPLAHLDPLARREFLRVVTDAVAGGRGTALLSSHVITDVEQSCDRLLVLGQGRVLLHCTIDEALSQHSVTISPVAPEADSIGTFAGPDGRTVELIAQPPDADEGRRTATLEEVVLGYLARGRRVVQ